MEREVSVKAKEAERRVISPSAEDNSIINSPPPQRKPQANQEPPSGSVKNFNKFLTSGDLEASFYEKLRSEALFWYIYISSFKFVTLDDLWWPRELFFFEKLRSSASFLHLLYLLSIVFEICPFFRIFELKWPLVTSRSGFEFTFLIDLQPLLPSNAVSASSDSQWLKIVKTKPRKDLKYKKKWVTSNDLLMKLDLFPRLYIFVFE